jgi:predicted DCC family thiol-disulfide oxidoreductase YuxK
MATVTLTAGRSLGRERRCTAFWLAGLATSSPFLPTVLYDASCGFCARWVPFWAPTLKRVGFDIAPLQDPSVVLALDLPSSELMNDIRLLLPSGEHLQGADVYRYVMRRIWWTYPFYLASITPFLSTVFDRTYRAFARNRFRISRACGLQRPVV